LSSIAFEDGTNWSIDDVTQLLAVPVGIDNIVTSSPFSNASSLDFSLNLLVQAYVSLDDSSDVEIGKVNTSYLASLPVVEY